MAVPSHGHDVVSPPSGANARRGKNNIPLSSQRNVREVILSDLRIEAWYPSFYAEDIIGKSVDRLFVCKWCFKYTTKLLLFMDHSRCCNLHESGPIGNKIYEKDNVSIFEVDGEEHRIFTQNLSLFAKLFLDTKSVFYDVTTFLYYVLYYNDPAEPNTPARIVGFFSKEKLSWDNNNLACICVFPPWQKRRLGQVLMGASYELSKWDGRLGGPEKPLSELGRRAYINFWAATIARHVVSLPPKKKVTVKSISEATYILPDDIVSTLREMNVLDRKAGAHGSPFINKPAVVSWMAANRVDMSGPVDDSAFIVHCEAHENGE